MASFLHDLGCVLLGLEKGLDTLRLLRCLLYVCQEKGKCRAADGSLPLPVMVVRFKLRAALECERETLSESHLTSKWNCPFSSYASA